MSEKQFAKIEDLPFFQGLPLGDISQIKPCLIEKKIAKGQMIFSEGESCNRIFIVRSGRIKLFKVSANGREQILDVLSAGDTCACNPGSHQWFCSSSGQALSDSVVWFLSREHYVRLVQNNSRLSQSLIHLLAERLCRFGSLIEQVSLTDTQKRLAKFILDMNNNSVARKTEENIIAIPFTREEIAQRLGSTRETITRHLNAFKRSKLIGIKPKQILILNPEGLKKIVSN